jgi:hypothetical protein
MPTAPKRYARKRNKDGSYNSIDLTSFAAVTQSTMHRVVVDQICDSAFLAERGILTCMESPKHAKTTARNRSGEAA